MKHAGPAALDALSDLLARLRGRAGLVERRPGVFYRRGRAFLHFHEDPHGLFADVRPDDAWLRLPADGEENQARLIAAVDQALAGAP